MTQIELVRQEIERRIKLYSITNEKEQWIVNTYRSVLSFLDTLQEPEFPATDEEMEAFLASHPKVEVPEKYKTPDWLYKELEQEPEVDVVKALDNYYKEVDWSPSEAIEYDTHLDIAKYFCEFGKKEMREQMLKDGIDCKVKIDAGGYPYIERAIELYDYDKDEPLAKMGDRYKLVVIKVEEDDKDRT